MSLRVPDVHYTVKTDDTSVKSGVDQTRLRILGAARELYAEKGSRGTTTREVADRAGVNEATLFRHFGTKGQLLSAMLEHFSYGFTSRRIVIDDTVVLDTLTTIVQPGPRAAPGNSQFRITLEDADGKHQTVLRLGENRLPVDLAAGRGAFAITIEEPVSSPVPGKGDLRPMVLRLTEYAIERGGAGQP